MNWIVIAEIVMASIALIYSVYRVIKAIKDGKLLPIVLQGIEDAERQEGLSGEEKLNHALDYIKREATTKGISVDIAKTVELITTLVSLTKKVNFR